MTDEAPNGCFSHDLIVFGDMAKPGASVAQGFVIGPPDLTNASATTKKAVREKLINWQRSLPLHQRAQIQWRVTSDYKRFLDKYDEITAQTRNPAARAKRAARGRLYRQRMADGKLRREECVLFVATKILSVAPKLAAASGVRKYVETILNQQRNSYDQMAEELRRIFGADVQVDPMGELDMKIYCWKWANPSRDNESELPWEDMLNQPLSIQELVWNSDITPVGKCGFYQDGNYHQILTLKNLGGRGSKMGMITNLTTLPQQNYRITVRLTPIDVEREIDIEEKMIERLGNEQRDRPRIRRAQTIEAKTDKTTRLAKGASAACVTMVIRAWASTEALLSANIAGIKNAVNSMHGCQCYEDSLPVSAQKLYFLSFPGWCFSTYVARDIYLEDVQAAEILPLSSTFTGSLENAEALYEGANNNLVGVATFADGTPQLAICIGSSGSGKSYNIQDLLFQSDYYYQDGYTCILDDGLSHQPFARAHGVPTITITPDSPYRINYLDTVGLPLSKLHHSFASTMAAHFAGQAPDAFARDRNKAMLGQYIHELYRNFYESWKRRNRPLIPRIEREACAIDKWFAERMAGGDDTRLDAYTVIRDGLAAGNDEITRFVESIPAEEILRFSKNETTSQFIVDHAFSYFKKEEYPRHAHLVELMESTPNESHDEGVVKHLATMLSNWTAISGGSGLFDGVSNVSLTGSIVHIELSGIPSEMMELKSAVALLLTGYIRQHIITLPRSLRKRVLYEEVVKLLRTLPDAGKLLEENYGQFRKYSAWPLTVMQQFAPLKNTDLCPIIFGNTKLMLLMRQNSAADILDISEASSIPLPPSMREAIGKYPSVDHLPKDKKHSCFCYFNPSAHPPICGTVRNFQPTEES